MIHAPVHHICDRPDVYLYGPNHFRPPPLTPQQFMLDQPVSLCRGQMHWGWDLAVVVHLSMPWPCRHLTSLGSLSLRAAYSRAKQVCTCTALPPRSKHPVSDIPPHRTTVSTASVHGANGRARRSTALLLSRPGLISPASNWE